MTRTLELPGVDPRADATARTEGEAERAVAAQVIGLDLSLVATGMSDGTSTWLVPSSGKKDATLADRRLRLRDLGRAICAGVPATTQLVVIEAPSFGSRDGHAHDRSGLWWGVVSSLFASGVPVAEVAPAAVKRYATGKGNADKGQMIEATTRRFPHVDTGGHDGRCDAQWLAAMGIDHLTGVNVVPESHRTSLVKVGWPARRNP